MSSDSQTALLSLASELISRPSITPDDAGCQQLIGERLQAIGFELEPMIFADTTNLWATRGNAKPLVVFAGHTDVVPAGDSALWSNPPFAPTIKDGYLYGRGAADMKGALAAMIIATERFISKHPTHHGSIGFLITSDEEGPFINGTTKVVDQLIARNQLIDYCIVGEPSSSEVTGDTIKNGRRGSLTANLTVFGKQGHVAYPHLAQNPIHLALPALTALSQQCWDQGNAFFPPTSMQLVNLNAGTGASNVIPASIEAQFNFRFSSELSCQHIKDRVAEILNHHQLNYQICWSLSGEPFLTPKGKLLNAAIASIETRLGITPTLSTSGGTSDGRFIAKMGGDVIELGPENSTIHQIDERVNIAGLTTLVRLYQDILERLLT